MKAAFALFAASKRPPEEVHKEADDQLFNKVLYEIMQLLVVEDQRDAERLTSPSCCRWASLSVSLLSFKRQSMLRQGLFLLRSERQTIIPEKDEQLCFYIILQEPTWVRAFPELTARCRSLLASRLENELTVLDVSQPARFSKFEGGRPAEQKRPVSKSADVLPPMVWKRRPSTTRTFSSLPAPPGLEEVGRG